MTTIYPPHIHHELKDFHVFLDTNVFIYAAKNESFFDFLASLKSDAHCGFATIPSVIFEFTNGANTMSQYNERVAFIKSIVDRIDPMAYLNKISDFYVVMSKVNEQNKAYTDFQLAACLYNYKHTKVGLLTADLKAFPAFYPRTHILAVEHKKEIKNFGVFQFDEKGYGEAAAKALNENSL